MRPQSCRPVRGQPSRRRALLLHAAQSASILTAWERPDHTSQPELTFPPACCQPLHAIALTYRTDTFTQWINRIYWPEISECWCWAMPLHRNLLQSMLSLSVTQSLQKHFSHSTQNISMECISQCQNSRGGQECSQPHIEAFSSLCIYIKRHSDMQAHASPY